MNDTDGLQELTKNLYLQRLEKLYKKFGVEKVYSARPATNKINENRFYIEEKIPISAIHELMDYSTSDGEDCTSGYYLRGARGIKNAYVFYDHGKFYGLES